MAAVAERASIEVPEGARELALFEYAIILQPKVNKDGEVVEAGQLLAGPETILASSPEQAHILVGRAIPEEHLGKLERITLAVRPF